MHGVCRGPLLGFAGVSVLIIIYIINIIKNNDSLYEMMGFNSGYKQQWEPAEYDTINLLLCVKQLLADNSQGKLSPCRADVISW